MGNIKWQSAKEKKKQELTDIDVFKQEIEDLKKRIEKLEKTNSSK